MAKPQISAALLSLLLVLTLFIPDFAECSTGDSSVQTLHRKLVLEMEKMGMRRSNGRAKLGSHEQMIEKQEDWELRRVPAGPDPLHHNRQDPNKPRTP